MPESYLPLFLLLCVGHFFVDYPMQNEFMAIYKSRHAKHPHVKEPYLWWHLLTAHAILHGGMVGIITGNMWLGLLEFVFHWFIDLAKNEKKTNLEVDQALHIVCKVFYVAVCATMAWHPWWYAL